MTDLTPDDLAILEREGCIVDADAAAAATYLAPSDLAIKKAAAALRAAGLEPGRPSVDLLLRAIEARGWVDYRLLGLATTSGPRHEAMVYVPSLGSCRARHPDPAVALALAFISAIRASEGATE